MKINSAIMRWLRWTVSEKTWITLALVLFGVVMEGKAAARPNVLFILADDLGWGDIGYHGSPAETPNIDRLARNGVNLKQHYVQPMCTPTRVAFLTGLYPSRFGDYALKPSNRRVFPPEFKTIGSYFNEIGCETGLAGKWHLGSKPEWGPGAYGFERTYGSLAGGVDPYSHRYKKGPYSKTWHRNGELVEEDGHVTELIGEEVVSWIRERKESWFYYVPFTAVHLPVKAPHEYVSRYAGQAFDPDPEKDRMYKAYLAYTTQMDHWIGEMLRALEETGQLENTIVVFSSDNGATPSSYKDVLKYPGHQYPHTRLGSNSPLRGWKKDLYEGGIRVPTFVYWKGQLGHRNVRSPVHIVDWLPTLSKVCGGSDNLAAKNIDGHDIWPLISGEQESYAEERSLYFKFVDGAWAMRKGRWKLGYKMNHNDLKEEFELFDIVRDPHETANLVEAKPEVVKELKQLRQQFSRGDERIPAFDRGDGEDFEL